MPRPAQILLVAGLLLGLPTLLSAQPVQRTSATPSVDFSTGWHVGAVWMQSVDQSPFGTRWGQETRGVGGQLEFPAIGGVRPSIEGVRLEVRERCGLSADCPFVSGWVFRAGGILGDLAPTSDSRVAPFLRGDVGVARAGDETHFSPSFRIGLLIRTVPRVTPQIAYGWGRYPEGRDGSEVVVGLRLTVR